MCKGHCGEAAALGPGGCGWGQPELSVDRDEEGLQPLNFEKWGNRQGMATETEPEPLRTEETKKGEPGSQAKNSLRRLCMDWVEDETASQPLDLAI